MLQPLEYKLTINTCLGSDVNKPVCAWMNMTSNAATWQTSPRDP